MGDEANKGVLSKSYGYSYYFFYHKLSSVSIVNA